MIQLASYKKESSAIKGWDKRNQFYYQMLKSLADHYNFDLEIPYEQLPENIQNIILYGSEKEQIEFSYFNEQGTINKKKHSFEGIINNFKRRYQETDSSTVRDELSKYLSNQECPACKGTRLRVEARNVLVGDFNLHEICKLPLKKTFDFFKISFPTCAN